MHQKCENNSRLKVYHDTALSLADGLKLRDISVSQSVKVASGFLFRNSTCAHYNAVSRFPPFFGSPEIEMDANVQFWLGIRQFSPHILGKYFLFPDGERKEDRAIKNDNATKKEGNDGIESQVRGEKRKFLRQL